MQTNGGSGHAKRGSDRCCSINKSETSVRRIIRLAVVNAWETIPDMVGMVGDRYRGADNAFPDSRSHDFTLP